jgi:DNA helicase II / ATP-dependent DNA helicase PcrA
MDVSSILGDLNEIQRQAVTSPPGNQLILAGAGSGKTRVLVHRIAWLIQVENISPYSIMAVTFTNKAAREMRNRLEQLLSGKLAGSSRSMWVGTFHGIAHRLLKAHWEAVSLPQNFQIIDSDDQLRIIKRIGQRLDLEESQWPPRQMQAFINTQKDQGVRPQYLQETTDIYQSTMLSIYRNYEQVCRQGGLVDFGELLLRAHELLLQHPDVLAHYQRHFPFILVDEFQDTNTIQYAWLRALVGAKGYITAVGDDDQSIYGWRGARIENIHRINKDFAKIETIRLEQNYRSTGLILKAANGVIANNRDRLGKTLWTTGKEGEPISLYAAFNEYDEARFIVDGIKSWAAENNSYNSVAILYRSNAQSRILEEALLRENIAYRIYGGLRFYDRLEIKNLLAYLRLIINRNDDTAFERIINTPARGLGDKTLDSIRQHAREQKCSLWQSAAQLSASSQLSARAGNAIDSFMALINELSQATDELSLGSLTERVSAKSGLLDYYHNEKGEKGLARVENLEELINACRIMESTPTDRQSGTETRSLLELFLDNVALDAGETQADELDDAVQLMTLHSSKGLEFPRVFMAGVEEHLFPHKMSIEDPAKLAEERRLCYVGITRAMEKLTISYAEVRRVHGEEKYHRQSRFIREIPSECLQEVRLKTEIRRAASFSAIEHNSADEDGNLTLGQRVSHTIFGEGVVIHIEGRGNNTKVQINFDNGGSKWLVMQYANLKILDRF